MATTIETLFGIDPSVLKLKQDQMGATADANFGALMPKGYGAIGSAFSKLGRNTIGQGGMFGSNDPALAKASKIESILVEANKTSGTPLEKYKTILALMEQDPSLGREAMALSEKIASDEAAVNKLAFDQSTKAIELQDRLDTNQATREDKVDKQIGRTEKQLVDKIKLNPDFFQGQALSVLDKGWNLLYADFNGEKTGEALQVLTEQFIRAKGANGKVMFNGLADALETAKTVLKASDPKATNWYYSDDEVNLDDTDPGSLFNLAAEEIKRRGGNTEVSIGKKEVKQETPVGPSGTTFVEMTTDGRAVFKYPDGREVVAKGSK